MNLGHDSDTVGAIYGFIAGAYYSIENIPTSFLAPIHFSKLISTIAEELYTISNDEERIMTKEVEKKKEEMLMAEKNLESLKDEISSSQNASKKYLELITYFKKMEKAFSSILRRLDPGPKRYKTFSDFDTDVKEFAKQFQLPVNEESDKSSLFKDFGKRFKEHRLQISYRTGEKLEPFPWSDYGFE